MKRVKVNYKRLLIQQGLVDDVLCDACQSVINRVSRSEARLYTIMVAIYEGAGE